MKVLLFANTDWYLYNFRRSLAEAIRLMGHEVLLVSPAGDYGERLTALGFRWIPAPMHRRSLNPLRELALLRWLRDLIRRERPTVVHGFTVKCAVYGALAARFEGVPARVSAVAGMGYVFTSDDLKARALRPVIRTLMRFALDGKNARLILQNPDDVELFQRSRLLEGAHIRLIPGSGVDCERFTPKESTGAAEGTFRLVLPARLLWDKGIKEYVEAARLLRSEGRAIEFLVAGEPDPGNPAAVEEDRIRQWVADGLVNWLGHVDDMPALFHSVDAVALPSYREGLPKGLIEAAACGLPIVTTDVPGCRHVVTHGVDGLIVPPRDSMALARAIAGLHDSPQLRSRLGAAARERALREFDERKVIERTIDVYGELVPNR